MKTAIFMRSLGMLLSGAMLLAGCTKDEPAALSIDPAPGTLTFSAAGTESYTYAVKTNQPSWNAVSDQTWCVVTAGPASGTFTVTARANELSAAPAPATITVTAGEATPLTLTATQQAAAYDEYMLGQCVKADGSAVSGWWKNGQFTAQALPAGVSHIGLSDFAVSDGSVYLGGYYQGDQGMVGCWWQNGTLHEPARPAGALDSQINSLAVSGGSVYLLDAYFLNGAPRSDYYRDGVRTALVLPEGDDVVAYALAVSDGSVYVVGEYCPPGGKTVPCLWKDGTATRLDMPAGVVSGMASLVCVSDGWVCACGVYYNGDDAVICYWKNGVCIPLTLPAGADWTSVGEMAVSDGSVYVPGSYTIGQRQIPCLWKDGVPTPLELPAGAGSASLASVVASGGSLYVSGSYWKDNRPVAGVWKDGVWSALKIPEGYKGSWGGRLRVVRK